jgi:hypothetical protein
MGQDDQDGKSQDPVDIAVDPAFEALRARDTRNERRIFRAELLMIAVTALLTTAYILALLFRRGVLTMPPL